MNLEIITQEIENIKPLAIDVFLQKDGHLINTIILQTLSNRSIIQSLGLCEEIQYLCM